MSLMSVDGITDRLLSAELAGGFCKDQFKDIQIEQIFN